MNRWIMLITACVVAFAWASARAEEGRIRVGTVDGRTAALAYWRSDLHNKAMQQLMADRNAAQKAGDAKRVKELQAKGEALQREAHVQVFGTGPYDTLKQHLAPIMPEVARAAGVDTVSLAVLYAGDKAEVVDITEQLLQALHASDDTRKVIEAMNANVQRGEYDPTKYNPDQDKD